MHIKLLKHITQEYLDNLNDPEVNKFLSTRNHPQTLETAEKWRKENHPWGIFVDDKLIGTLHLYNLPCVGILIFKNHQRKGYGLKALNEIKKSRMFAGIDSGNIASIELFKKAGFKARMMWEYNGL